MNPLKVGMLTLIAIASIVYMSLRITANQSGFGEYIPYKTIVDDAAGIIPKTPIKVAGINVGKIRNIELQGSKALINFEILEDIKVTKDSILSIKSVGFLGDKYIDIFIKNRNAPRLEPESMILSKKGGGIEDLAEGASDAMVDVKDILKNIRDSLRNDKGESQIAPVIENLKELTASLRRMTTNNEEKIHEIINSVDRLTAQLAKETDAQNQESLMNKLHRIDPILANVEQATEDLKVVMGDIRAGKGSVGKLLRDDRVVDQVSDTLSSINRLVNRINNIEADIALFTGINTENGNHTQFDLDIFPAPERFFRIGIVTNEFGPEVANETTTTTSIDGGPDSIETKRVVKKDSFKFNFQIGRKIQRIGIRAGLIESTGGVGVDYHIPNYGLRLSTEAFDYQKDAGPNIRFITEFRMLNVFYSRIAAEDMLLPQRSFTISAGLRFTDQDLTALLGLLAR